MKEAPMNTKKLNHAIGVVAKSVAAGVVLAGIVILLGYLAYLVSPYALLALGVVALFAIFVLLIYSVTP